MRPILLTVLLITSSLALAQTPRFESKELTCRVLSIEPGLGFAFERMIVEISGEKDFFAFHPSNGKLITENIKEGQSVSIRVTIDLRGKKSFEKAVKDNKEFEKAIWFMRSNTLDEIKIGTEWIKLKVPDEPYKPLENSKAKFEYFREYQVLLDQSVVNKYQDGGKTKALIFKSGLVFYNQLFNRFFDFYEFRDPNVGDLVSFIGTKLPQADGYRYPVEGVTEAYYARPLRKESGKMKALLFKQNHVCIGVKFTTKGEDLSVSFPSDKAIAVREFINPDKDVKIYYGPFSELDKFNLPELHAIIQEKDTLFIKDSGFYGGADVKHDHKDVQFEGKITSIVKTKKGNVGSLIVGSEFYVEINPMMAQLLEDKFQKGKKVIIQGQDRIKKMGEIYNENYRIITPEKITLDGITFSAHKP